MKKWMVVLLTCMCLTVMPTKESHAILWTVVKAAVKKVIRAMDLAVQRMQNETIKLQNAQKALENALSKLKLKEISEWSQKQKDLFNTYYDELWKVKNAIAYYNKARKIVEGEKQLVSEYQRAMALFRRDKNFSVKRLERMAQVYTGILEQSVKNVEQVAMVINSFATQMADSKRMEIIDGAAQKLQENLSDLRQYTNENILFSVQKAKDQQELNSIRTYYGL